MLGIGNKLLFLPQVNFNDNNLNFQWSWRWCDWIQAIFLNLFYFTWFPGVIWLSKAIFFRSDFINCSQQPLTLCCVWFFVNPIWGRNGLFRHGFRDGWFNGLTRFNCYVIHHFPFFRMITNDAVVFDCNNSFDTVGWRV